PLYAQISRPAGAVGPRGIAPRVEQINVAGRSKSALLPARFPISPSRHAESAAHERRARHVVLPEARSPKPEARSRKPEASRLKAYAWGLGTLKWLQQRSRASRRSSSSGTLPPRWRFIAT